MKMEELAMKTFKRIICFSLICILAINSVPGFAKAAKNQAEWSLFFSPAQPSSEWALKETKNFTAYGTEAWFYVDSISDKTKVGILLENMGRNEHTFTSTGSFCERKLPKGFCYTVKIRYIDYTNKLTRAKGHVNA